MLHRLLATAAACATLAAPAIAMDDLEQLRIATELGSVLASEEICGLTYDQAAIGAFIEQTVPADAMGFAANLQMMTVGAAYNAQTMTASAKTAHCASIRQTARHYGFVK